MSIKDGKNFELKQIFTFNEGREWNCDKCHFFLNGMSNDCCTCDKNDPCRLCGDKGHFTVSYKLIKLKE